MLGGTVFRLRHPILERKVFEGGVRRPASFPRALLAELSRVGNRRGHYRAFLSLVRHWPSWEAVRPEYARIDRPVLVRGAGHFLSLEAPEELSSAVTQFARGAT
ncbi:MAG TPA: hypothetical protein VFU46_09625 [Gemmatimonadales bacterium]|nr:hypothetical protein [Gemmatimonadales bacterium]